MENKTKQLIDKAEQDILANLNFLIRIRVQDELREIKKLSQK